MNQTLLNDRYRIIQKLGEGGFGDTFLAEDTQMPSKRRCVIKQLKPITTNPQIWQLVQERFEREAAILEKLGDGSDRIPRLYAYFTTPGQFYLVQEWIKGETLTQKVEQQGTLNENAVRDILISLLPVLDYVHSHRIVHRDIKPDNIILRQQDGTPVLIDFGAVKEKMGTVVNTQGNTANSIVIGTPGFMANEQAAGRPLPSSDLYSLGLTAIYLLTGKQPQEFEMNPNTGDIIWREHALSVSHNLAKVLDKAIKNNISDRYPSAKDMLKALQSSTSPIIPTIVSPLPKPTVVVPPHPNPTNPHPFVSLIRQNRPLVAIAGGAIGILAIVNLVLNKQSSPVVKSSISPAPTVTPSPVQSVQPPVSVATITPSPVQSVQPPVSTAPPSTPSDSSPSPSSMLDQIIPSKVPSAFSPTYAFANCPENTTLYLLGETPSFKFALCGNNGKPSHGFILDKANENKVTELTQAGDGFTNGENTYKLPSYENSSYSDASLRVYEGNAVSDDKQLYDEKVIQLYKLAAQ